MNSLTLWFGVLAVCLSFSAACGSEDEARTQPQTTAAGDLPTATGEDSLVGTLQVIIGDPAPASGGEPQYRYLLTTTSGELWTLVFDQDRYWPPGGPPAFNGEQIVVSGSLITQRSLSVESLAGAVALPEATPSNPPTNPPPATPGLSGTSTAEAGSITVSGFFVQIFGDPPPGSNGEPRSRYTLTTAAAEEWSLMFDADVYLPTSGFEAYSLRQVVVEGVVLTDGQILVQRMELQ